MVAKGVLREHLILLASIMTCGGNLVGFNIGGYKALARQLNIQVPFTDATLFVSALVISEIMRCIMSLFFSYFVHVIMQTPRKCFERVAEK